jgi:hypothetical protein
MADTEAEDVEQRALLAFPDARRAIVLAIVTDLNEDALLKNTHNRPIGGPAPEPMRILSVSDHEDEQNGHLAEERNEQHRPDDDRRTSRSARSA